MVGDLIRVDQRVDTSNAGGGATWHAPEGGDVAGESEGGGGGSDRLHLDGRGWLEGRVKKRLRDESA